MESKAKILLVGTEQYSIDSIINCLEGEYQIYIELNAQQIEEQINDKSPDLIVVDITVATMEGYQICLMIKNNPQWTSIPVLLLIEESSEIIEAQVFDSGADDFVTKPIIARTLLSRIATHLSLVEARNNLINQSIILEEKVRQRTLENESVQDAAIYSLMLLAEARDKETGEHIQRTQLLVKALAKKLQQQSKYRDFFDDKTIELLFKSAPLHDIGKIAVPDHILKKPGALSPEEKIEMQKHTTHGGDAIKNAEKLSGSSSFLKFAQEIAYSHQEKWDGTGYPKGLKGNEIPLSARLMAIADVYDALVSKRVYKTEYSHQEALEYIKLEKGYHFDPDMVDAFLEIEAEFEKINQLCKDTHS